MTKLAITGSTGNIGGRVARHLADAGLATRLIVRDANRAPNFPPTDVRTAEYGDAEAVRAALDGVETVFMVSASESDERLQDHKTFVDAAVAAGVRHLIYLSFAGASADAGFTLARDHGATEDHIRASGLTWTFLRDNFYAEAIALMGGEDRIIRGPAGEGQVAAVGYDDVGEVAAKMLIDPAAHAGATYDLTGPKAVTLTELAQLLTDITGQTYSFYNETMDEARASRAPYGAPDWQVEAWISTYTAIRDGELEHVSGDIDNILGRPATPLAAIFAAGDV